MKPFKELAKTEGYWQELIENKVYKDLGLKIDASKGDINKMIKSMLKLGLALDIRALPIGDYIKEKIKKQEQLKVLKYMMKQDEEDGLYDV